MKLINLSDELDLLTTRIQLINLTLQQYYPVQLIRVKFICIRSSCNAKEGRLFYMRVCGVQCDNMHMQ